MPLDLKKWPATLLLCASIFLSNSCGEGQKTNLEIPGVRGPEVTLIEDKVLISMAFENLTFDLGLRYPIPKYPHSYLELSPDLQSGGILMGVSVSIEDLLNGEGKYQDPKKLPGGRPLPGVLGGQLPAVAFTIEKFHNITFYLGPEVFGLFVPVKDLNMNGSIITSRFYIKETRAGNLSLVGEDDKGDNSGFLLLLDMKGKIKQQLELINKRYH